MKKIKCLKINKFYKENSFLRCNVFFENILAIVEKE
jgi:hypothetical protein